MVYLVIKFIILLFISWLTCTGVSWVYAVTLGSNKVPRDKALSWAMQQGIVWALLLQSGNHISSWLGWW